jgi:hypothetical protein
MPAKAGIQYSAASRLTLRRVVTGSSAFADDDSGELLLASRFREEKISLRTIRGLKETARPVPAWQCGHRYFFGLLDSFIRTPHHLLTSHDGARITRSVVRRVL